MSPRRRAAKSEAATKKKAAAPTVEGWHFLVEDGRLRFDQRQKVEVGKTLTFKGKPVLCECGFHASVKALDALQYAPGPICCRVVLGGEIVHGTDKCGKAAETLAVISAFTGGHLLVVWNDSYAKNEAAIARVWNRAMRSLGYTEVMDA